MSIRLSRLRVVHQSLEELLGFVNPATWSIENILGTHVAAGAQYLVLVKAISAIPSAGLTIGQYGVVAVQFNYTHQVTGVAAVGTPSTSLSTALTNMVTYFGSLTPVAAPSPPPWNDSL